MTTITQTKILENLRVNPPRKLDFALMANSANQTPIVGNNIVALASLTNTNPLLFKTSIASQVQILQGGQFRIEGSLLFVGAGAELGAFPYNISLNINDVDVKTFSNSKLKSIDGSFCISLDTECKIGDIIKLRANAPAVTALIFGGLTSERAVLKITRLS